MSTCFRGKGRAWALPVIFLALLLSAQHALAEDTYNILQLEIAVYRDGVVHVRSSVAVNSTFPSISLQLLGDAKM